VTGTIFETVDSGPQVSADTFQTARSEAEAGSGGGGLNSRRDKGADLVEIFTMDEKVMSDYRLYRLLYAGDL
jgi:hypothetical protein